MLSPGDRVAVVAPSGIFDPARLDRSEALIRGWGLVPVHGPNLGAKYRFTAGTPGEREADLRWALTDPNISGVWFARGGYGTVHLLAALDAVALDGRPVIGFSDATALFCAMAARGASGAVHGPVLHSLADHVDEASRAALRALLFGGSAQLTGRQVAGPAADVRGPVVGGNLTVLASLAGTPWAMRARDSIVVLEDVGEAPYRLDRVVSQLLLSGAFDGAVGIGLGSWAGCRAPESAQWSVQELLCDLLTPLGLPIVADLPVGHAADNHAWRHGALGRLHAGGLDVD